MGGIKSEKARRILNADRFSVFQMVNHHAQQVFSESGRYIEYADGCLAIIQAEQDAEARCRDRVEKVLNKAHEQYPEMLQGFKNYFLSLYDNPELLKQ